MRYAAEFSTSLRREPRRRFGSTSSAIRWSSIRSFDPETQRTASRLEKLHLVPLSEVHLTPDTVRRFRMKYAAQFGGQTKGDQLYETVSESRRYPGLEHWLPLFADRLETLFDYLPDAVIVLEPLVEEAASERLSQIADYYSARVEALEAGQTPLYKPLPPELLYFTPDQWTESLRRAALVRLNPFASPEARDVVDLGGKVGRNFAPERAVEDKNLFDLVAAHARVLDADKKHVVFTFWSEGSRDRMQHVLADHGLKTLRFAANWTEVLALPKGTVGLAVFGLETGFESADAAFISEQDALGDRLTRPRRRQRRAGDFIAELTSLEAGNLVVHVDHGIGRFMGLKSIEALGAPHDCLEIHYAGDSRLFLPVENLELLSRYGNEETAAELDRLGGVGWQSRKAKLKTRIREMAAELVRVAAPGNYGRRRSSRRRRASTTNSARGFRMTKRRIRTRRSSCAGRSCRRPAYGSSRLRRRRVRQDGSCFARRIRDR